LIDISESNGCTAPGDFVLRRLIALENWRFFSSVSDLWKTFTKAAFYTGVTEVVCVLDALDECLPDGRNDLIKAINNFYQIPQSQVSYLLKLFLTSRPYGNKVKPQFSIWGNRLQEIRLVGEEGDVTDDIEEKIKLTVNRRIDQICKTFNFSEQEKSLMKTNLGAIPGRTYLWISLVFDDFLDTTASIHRKLINEEGVKRVYIEKFVKNPPKTVDDAYEKTLNWTKMGGVYQEFKTTRLILQMVSGAKRPLTLREMSIALAFKEYDLSDVFETEENIWNTIRDRCGPLVDCVNGKLYFLHQTLREFLVAADPDCNNENQKTHHTQDNVTTIPPSYLWKNSVNLTDTNSVFAEVCVSYLHMNFEKIDDSLHDYSAIYWIDHYRQSGSYCQAALAKMTESICLPSEQRTKWTQIYSKHNKIPESRSLFCLASALGLDRVIEEFLHDKNSTVLDLKNEVESKDSKYGQPALFWAAEYGHETVVKLLLEAKADIESRDIECDMTPLSIAAEEGHEAVAKLLLEANADIESKDSQWGQNPLSWAAENGYEAVVKLLIEAKANIESKNTNLVTALSLAAWEGNDEVVKLLIEAKADIESIDNEERTALAWAAEYGQEDVVRLLLEVKADVDTNNGDFILTPLSRAAENGYDAVVKLLIEAKADVNARESNCHLSVLSLAAINGHEDVVELLLEAKADIELKDYEYCRTPLSRAARTGQDDVVKLLLEANANVESKDDMGQKRHSFGQRGMVMKLLSSCWLRPTQTSSRRITQVRHHSHTRSRVGTWPWSSYLERVTRT
jgi:ankyrin repeat protein